MRSKWELIHIFNHRVKAILNKKKPIKELRAPTVLSQTGKGIKSYGSIERLRLEVSQSVG